MKTCIGDRSETGHVGKERKRFLSNTQHFHFDLLQMEKKGWKLIMARIKMGNRGVKVKIPSLRMDGTSCLLPNATEKKKMKRGAEQSQIKSSAHRYACVWSRGSSCRHNTHTQPVLHIRLASYDRSCQGPNESFHYVYMATT